MGKGFSFLIGQNGAKDVKRHKNLQAPHIMPADFTHVEVKGITGSGKTTGFNLPNILERIKLSHALLAYDYKGNLSPQIKVLAKKCKRLEDVVEIGVPWAYSINILKELSLREIEELSHEIFKDSPENIFWENSAVALAMSVVKPYKSLATLFSTYIEPQTTVGELIGTLNFVDFDFKEELSFATVYKAVNSVQQALNFYKALRILKMKLERFCYENRESIEKRKVLQVNLLHTFQSIDESIKVFEQFKIAEDDYDKTSENIIKVTANPLKILATNPMINKQEIDINEALDQGKIVILVFTSFSDTVTRYLTHTIFEKFRKRFKQKNITPVSVFIDEAQRVFKGKAPVALDTMREAKVEVFLSFQDEALMLQSLGHEEWNALKANLSKKVILKTREDSDEIASSKLKPFEFYTNMDGFSNIYRAEPIFLSFEEIFAAEREHQIMNNVYDKIHIEEEIDEEFIFVHDDALFSKGSLMIETASRKSKIVKFFLQKDFEKAKNFLQKNIFYSISPSRHKSMETNSDRWEILDTLDDIQF